MKTPGAGGELRGGATRLWRGARALLFGAAVGGLVVGVAALLQIERRLDNEMAHALTNQRIHIEKMTTIRRGVRMAHVEMLERWLAPLPDKEKRAAAILMMVRATHQRLRDFMALAPLGADEDDARDRLHQAITLWSDRVRQTIAASDGSSATPELRGLVDAVDGAANDILRIDSIAGASTDERVTVLHREEGLLEGLLLASAAVILATAWAWWRAKRRADVRWRVSEEAALRQQELTRLRAQFFANMSHELRTPLVAIQANATVLEKGAPAEQEIRRAGHRIRREAVELLVIINNILDASKLESGHFSFDIESVALPPVLERCLDRCQALVGDKRLELLIELPDKLPPVRADVVKLQQVMVNLLANAIKFTPSGKVILRASDRGAHVLIEVEDTGPGIEADGIERIWRPFEQADGTIARSHGGTGLGLSIVKGIVERLGGSVGLTSTKGAGATFSILLPVSGGAESAAPNDAPPSSSTSSTSTAKTSGASAAA